MANRIYNLWLSNVSLRGRKTCPSCGEKTQLILSLGEYVSGKYRRATYCCALCLVESVQNNFKPGEYRLQSRSGYSFTRSGETITVRGK